MLSLSSFAVAALLAMAGSQPTWVWNLVLFGLGAPYLAMIAHLHFSNELSDPERTAWRRELWWGHRAIVAVWTYLLVKDLKQASTDLVDNGREWWRP